MKRLIIYYLIVIMAFFTNCQQKEEKSRLSNLYITFKVDSIKIYDARNIDKNIFMFSPLGHKDKIWTINTSNPYELDLINGEWSPLTKRFGKILKGQIREEDIWKDSFTGEIYISLFHDGLIRYYPEKDTFDFLKIHPVTGFHSRKNNIVLGTSNGLYFFNRNENNISVAEKFPLNIWVKSIQELDNDTLLINNKYYYHLSSNTFGKKYFDNSTTNKNTNYNYISREAKRKLPRFGGVFREFKSDNISWYYKEGELYYSANVSDFFKFTLFPQGYVRHILEDKQYLYVLFNEKFVIFNKEYIFRNSIIYEVSNYQKLQNELSEKMDSLYHSKKSLDKYLANAIKLYKNEKYSAYSDLQNRLLTIPKIFEYYDVKEGIDNLNSILENDTIPLTFKHSILKGLCRKFTISAELDSAMIYFNLIKELYPSYRDKCIDYSYPCVKKAYIQLDSIRNENISTVESLFFEAKVLEKMIYCCCWFGDSYYNYSIVEKKYQDILTNHPNSDYADDAEFWLINNQFNYEGGEGYPLNEIPKIRKFISKYPNSNFIKELQMNIAKSYLNGYSENIDDRIKNIDKGINILENLKNNHQLDSIEFANVEEILKQSAYEKNKLIYTLTVVPLKSVYKINEDIEVEIMISNNSSTPKKLKLFQNDSCYVSFWIPPDNKVRFIPFAETDTIKKDFEIIKGKSLKQKIRINKLARHWDGGKLGRFSFEEEGLYNLTCFSRENNLSSNQVKIYIKK